MSPEVILESRYSSNLRRHKLYECSDGCPCVHGKLQYG